MAKDFKLPDDATAKDLIAAAGRLGVTVPPEHFKTEAEGDLKDPDKASGGFAWADYVANSYAIILSHGQPGRHFNGFKAYANQLIQHLAPQDCIEEMMVSQLVLTQARIAMLSRNATTQKNIKWFDMFNTTLDRAASTYRRQLNALLDYRKPRRRPSRTTYTTIRTAHFKTKQVLNALEEVGNVIGERRKKEKEIVAVSTQEASAETDSQA